MVVKPLNAVVVDTAVVGTWRLIEVAGVIVADHHLVAIYKHLLCPAVVHTATEKVGSEAGQHHKQGDAEAPRKRQTHTLLFYPANTPRLALDEG
jgi:hypothetical protein